MWQDVFDALTASEQSCIRSELDDDMLRSVLKRRVLTDTGSGQWEESIYNCVSPDTARSLLLANLMAVMGEAMGFGELSPEETSCLRESVATLDVVALRADDAAAAALGLRLLGCVPDVLLAEVFGEMGVDLEDLSEVELSCLREWVATLDADALGSVMAGDEDEAAAAALGLGLFGCVGDLNPSDDHGDPAEGATVVTVDESAAHVGDGSLGVVRIEAGDAIDAASYLDGGALVVDRQGVRDYLNNLEGFSGLSGTITCDAFGECGANRITVIQNIGGEANAEARIDNVVFSFSP